MTLLDAKMLIKELIQKDDSMVARDTMLKALDCGHYEQGGKIGYIDKSIGRVREHQYEYIESEIIQIEPRRAWSDWHMVITKDFYKLKLEELLYNTYNVIMQGTAYPNAPFITDSELAEECKKKCESLNKEDSI